MAPRQQSATNSEVASADAAKNAEPLTVIPATPAPAARLRRPSTGPAALADADAQINDQVKQGRMFALGGIDSRAARYQQAATPQDALTLLNARKRDTTDNSTIVITLVSRDSQDVQRLESLLTTYADQAQSKKLASQTQTPKESQITGGGLALGGPAGGTDGGLVGGGAST